MDKNILLKQLLGKKVRDYGFVVFFLFIFSFFIIFIIKPNISLVFKLSREKTYLDQLDKNYENVIIDIVNLQSEMEKVRSNLEIIDQALPDRVRIDKVVDELNKSASVSSVLIKKLTFSNFSLIDKVNDKKLNKIQFSIEFLGNFKNTLDYMKLITKQRRLKVINQIIIDKPVSDATDSADLNIKLSGETYNL